MKICYPEISISYVRDRLSYDAEEGVLRWRSVVGTSNRKVGQIAGRTRADGYLEVRINGRLILVHRLIWLIVHGQWPPLEIDHINGNKGDNRIANLRLADRKTNMQNQRRHSLGVSRVRNKFRARITVNGHRVQIGMYNTEEEARVAYLSAKRKLHEGCAI